MKTLAGMKSVVAGSVLAVCTLVLMVPQAANADLDRLKRQADDAREDIQREKKDAREDAQREKKDARGDVKRDIRH